MEVHHHAHTARKRWTHYLWEFLMLFLAVFCGFLAENQREHFVENHRAKDYAKGLINDLKDDTSELKTGLLYITFIKNCVDSLISMVNAEKRDGTVPGSFYYYSRFVSHSYPIDWNKSTINQLILSGNLRYFKNKELVNKINKFYTLESSISNRDQTDLIYRDKIVELRNQILVGELFSGFTIKKIWVEVYAEDSSAYMDSLIEKKLPLQKGYNDKMDAYINYLSDRSQRLGHFIEKDYPSAVSGAEQIITLLKNEYKLR